MITKQITLWGPQRNPLGILRVKGFSLHSICSILCSEGLLTVAIGSFAVAVLCHSAPPVLHIGRIAMTYCCDMYNVYVALCVGKVAQRFGPTLICVTEV